MSDLPESEKQTQLAAMFEGLPHRYAFGWYTWAWDFYKSTNKMALLCAANQVSKAVASDEDIATPSGWRKVADIVPGDRLFSRDGGHTKVLAVPYEGEDECFEFIFDDGSRCMTSKDHVWVAKGYKQRFVKSSKSSGAVGLIIANESYGEWQTFSTAEILAAGKYAPTTSAWLRFAFPICGAADYPEKTLPDPYLVGLLIGDGSIGSKSLSISNPEPEIGEYVLRAGAKRMNVADHCPTFYCGAFRGWLEELGLYGTLSHTKFIPKEYLTSSIAQRKALLAGLMDTDGTASTHGSYSYSTASERLASDVCELVASLGGKTRTAKRAAGYTKDGVYHKCKDNYTIHVLTDFCPFRLPRKAARWYPIRYKHERVLREVRAVGVKACRCFTVDSSDSTFLFSKNYLVTHNSSTQIRKQIEWAGNTKLWPTLWKTPPKQFWYLYPDASTATSEFDTKWVDFMPKGAFKDHPTFGWKVVRGDKRMVDYIQWNSGVRTVFKSYTQNLKNLQGGTCHYMALDEEGPIELLPELQARLFATDGYFSMVFTATLNQDLWKLAMEGEGEMERFPDAFKQTVSMRDCFQYRDGSPGAFTEERVRQIEATCASEQERQRRVEGKFITELGRKYPQYDAARHMKKPFDIPGDWRKYCSVDLGGGGAGHAPAIMFVAVRPDGRFGVVYKGWKGDDGPIYTSGDVYNKFRELRGRDILTSQTYDQANKDFNTIATRGGEPFQPSDKSHDRGEDVINTLFKNDMLFIFDTHEVQKLGSELTSLMKSTAKRSAKDDASDALRYCVVSIPWDWSALKGDETEAEQTSNATRAYTDEEHLAMDLAARRGAFIDPRATKKDDWSEIDDEFGYWQDQAGG